MVCVWGGRRKGVGWGESIKEKIVIRKTKGGIYLILARNLLTLDLPTIEVLFFSFVCEGGWD